MKQTLTTSEAAKEIINHGFSYSGAFALAEWLEELEEATGEQMELDGVAIGCDFSEYESLADWRKDYFADEARALEAIGGEEGMDADELDDLTRDHINDHGTLIEADDCIVVSSF